MKFDLKKLIIVLCFVAVASLSFSVVYGAYYGKGIFKDVFVNRKNHFTSDLLVQVKASEDWESSAEKTTGASKFSLCNYDLATGEYNAFDLTFAVYAKSEDSATDKVYNVFFGGKAYSVDKNSSFDTPLFTAVLPKGAANSVSVSISFGDVTSDNISEFPGVYVLAVPVEPSYMSPRALGALIGPFNSERFEVHSSFEYDEGSDINDYAAFNYVVSMIGEPDDGETVAVWWNSKVLSIMTENGTLPDGSEVMTGSDGDFDRYILLPKVSAINYSLFFTRAEVAEEETSPWLVTGDGAITWNKLTDYIKTV